MSNTDIVANEILLDKESWATSGKEDFLSLLEAVSMEVDEENEMKENEEFIDSDMSVDDFIPEGDTFSSLEPLDYQNDEVDLFEQETERLY